MKYKMKHKSVGCDDSGCEKILLEIQYLDNCPYNREKIESHVKNIKSKLNMKKVHFTAYFDDSTGFYLVKNKGHTLQAVKETFPPNHKIWCVLEEKKDPIQTAASLIDENCTGRAYTKNDAYWSMFTAEEDSGVKGPHIVFKNKLKNSGITLQSKKGWIPKIDGNLRSVGAVFQASNQYPTKVLTKTLTILRTEFKKPKSGKIDRYMLESDPFCALLKFVHDYYNNDLSRFSSVDSSEIADLAHQFNKRSSSGAKMHCVYKALEKLILDL